MNKKTNNNEITLSHKIKIHPHKEDWKNIKYILKDIQHEVNKVKGNTVKQHWSFDGNVDINKDIMNNKITTKDIQGDADSLITYINRYNKTKFTNSNGEVLEQAARIADARYRYEKKKMKRNEGYLPNFESNQPIPIKNNAFKIDKDGDNYILYCPRMLSDNYAEKLHKGVTIKYKVGDKDKTIYYSRDKNVQYDKKGNKKETKRKDLQFKLVVKDKRTKKILNDIINKNVTQCTSELLYKNKEWYLSVSYKYTPTKDESLKDDNIMGIDMGIVKPVYMAFNNNYNRYSIDGDEIIKFKKGVDARRKQMLRQGKYAGKGRTGHGRNVKLQPIQKLQNKVDNFKNSTNHKYSKYVIDMAKKHNCGVIQMEDLSGVASGEKKGTFLGDWTYYDLQSKIEYKAHQASIEVKKVTPDYTSQRCSKCGNIDKNNRDAKNNQELFQCTTCGFKTNADFNAAKNISMDGIEDIIKEQLEAQKKMREHVKKYGDDLVEV